MATMANQKETQAQIDAVLDAALDDLEDDESDDEGCHNVHKTSSIPNNPDTESLPKTNGNSTQPPPQQGPALPMPQVDLNQLEGIDNMMQELLRLGEGQNMEGGDNPDEFLGRFLQGVQSQLDVELQNEGNSTPEKSSPSKQKPPTPPADNTQSSPAKDVDDIDQAIASMLNGMAEQANMGTGNGPEDVFLKSMMGKLGDGIGEDVNADALIDGMMEQLLSKDLMYEPMKKVSEKFPQWLKDNKATLPEAEYKRRYKQAQYFQKLVKAYDTEPGNVQNLMALMQEVQEFGQPPPEIIQDIAPGLDLDADGLPKVDGSGGMPFPGGDEDCCIM